MLRTALEEARLTCPDIPWQERLVLLEHAARKKLSRLIADKTSLEPEQLEVFKKLLETRKSGTPLQIILRTAPFLDFEVEVEPGVFIPRPETAELVTATVEKLKKNPSTILEIGTGTGAVSIALSRKFPEATVIAVDISPVAIALAFRNAERLGISGKIHFVEGDLFSFPGACELKGKVDLMISNPPYIPSGLLDSLPDEVRCFDPVVALDGGEDGFRIVAKILDAAQEFLSQESLLALEIDPFLVQPLNSYTREHRLPFKTEVDSYGNLRFLFVRFE